MTEIKLEKGIELPRLCGGGKRKYPFEGMEVGDSFFVPFDGRERSLRNTLIACANNAFRNGEKFATRKIGDGIRIWRIK